MKKNDNKRCNQSEKKKKPSSKVVKTAVLGTVLGLFASAVVGLSVALYYAQTSVNTHEAYQRQIDAIYQRASFDLLDGASDLGINLRKISVSNSKSMQQSLLYEVWSASELAAGNLSTFKADDDGILKAQKFVNQLGDYSHTLALQLANGKSLSEQDRATLFKMGEVADEYQRALERVQRNLDEADLDLSDDGALDVFVQSFSSFAEPSFEYPEMIYDGPFSSALENRETKGLQGEEITAEQGAELVKEHLSALNPSEIQYVSEANGDIVTLDYTVAINGESAYVQIAKRGGMLISFNSRGEAQSASITEASKTCQERALAFARSAGFEDMFVVWSSSSDGECVINLAPLQDGVILYPDLVKVKVRESDNSIIGFDATHYAFNHCPRTLDAPAISLETATNHVSIPAIRQGRLALIPLRETREVLAYEFECHQNGVYYIYIDARTGEEVNILYVIEDDLGQRTA